MVHGMCTPCEARQDRTGQFTCRRCGYYWDRDEDAPECKTEKEIKDEKVARGVERGRAALNQMRDILK